MLRSMKDLEGYTIAATDGVIGHVKDFYFDDEAWVIRYLVVETGSWLLHRRVLISPVAINQANWSGKNFRAAISQEQVRNSPIIDTDKPVSRQHGMTFSGYFGYSYYWGGHGFWGNGAIPETMPKGAEYVSTGNVPTTPANQSPTESETDIEGREQYDPHLRSGNAITTYRVHATDGDIGHVQGMVIDEKTWAIRYLLVNTGTWCIDHEVLIARQWIEGVSWNDRSVSVSLTRDAVRSSPAHTPCIRIEREEESRTHAHYGRPGYWAGEVQLQEPDLRAIPSMPPGAIGKPLASEGLPHE